MAFVRPAGAAAVLVAHFLLLQSAGMGVLIHWARAYFARGPHRHGHLRSALLLVRFTSVVITLHLLQILLWTAFYRWNCNRSRTLASRTEFAARNTGFLVNPEKNLTPFRRI
jgi:hypothetical protein